MNVKQVSKYLDINEKKIYFMANNHLLPATKITGKWLFPKKLVDRWLINSCHNGMLSERLLITGSDDPLLAMLIARLIHNSENRELISYSATGSALGVKLLAQGHADVCALHWSQFQHTNLSYSALLTSHLNHQQWIMIHGYRRQQGFIVPQHIVKQCQHCSQLLQKPWRWVLRQKNAISQQYLLQWLNTEHHDLKPLMPVITAYSERELVGYIVKGGADIGFGCQSAAKEAGLSFIPILTESFDFVMTQSCYFRQQLQCLLSMLVSKEAKKMAGILSGYDLTDAGKPIWMANH